MSGEIRSRLLVLVGLAILGVALAGIGTALGMTAPLTAHGDTPQFVVNEDNITFSERGEEITVVENTSNIREVRIEKVDSTQFQVQTETEQPLTATERNRARQIVRKNGTAQQQLDSLQEYELSVGPVFKLDSGSSFTASVEISESSDEQEYKIVNITREDEDETVVVKRDSKHAEDRAIVRVRQPSKPHSKELKYSFRVDLAKGTVTKITDWGNVQADSTPQIGNDP